MAHTPGPWLVGSSDTREGSAVWADGGLAGATQVAICPREFMAHDANARLIAAAPDLLEALEAAFENDHESVFSQNFWDRARAAISKAYNG